MSASSASWDSFFSHVDKTPLQTCARLLQLKRPPRGLVCTSTPSYFDHWVLVIAEWHRSTCEVFWNGNYMMSTHYSSLFSSPALYCCLCCAMKLSNALSDCAILAAVISEILHTSVSLSFNLPKISTSVVRKCTGSGGDWTHDHEHPKRMYYHCTTDSDVFFLILYCFVCQLSGRFRNSTNSCRGFKPKMSLVLEIFPQFLISTSVTF